MSNGYLTTKEIHFFLEHYGITNDQGERLDFKDHPYLWDIYEDWAPIQAVRKAAQIGFSTTANIKALWLAKNRGMDIIYSLPSASDIKDFVSGKTNRLIANNQVFQKWTADKDSIEQKRVGSNVIYFRGCVDETTEILTNTGWKKYNEIIIGESLPSLNLATREIEGDVIKDVTVFQTEEEVLALKSHAIDAVVTKDHRCVVGERNKAELYIERAFNLRKRANQYIPIITEGIRKGDKVLDDGLVEVMGWVITEGSYATYYDRSRFVRKDGTISPKKYKREEVCIIQKNHVSLLEGALKRANFMYTKKRHGENGCFRFVLHARETALIKSLSPTKTLTFEFINKLTRAQMELLVDVMIKADGHTKKSGFQTFIQTDKTTLDAFQYLLILIGKGSALRWRHINHYGKKEVGEISVKESKNLYKYQVETVPYKGVMWCPTTRNGTIVTRRNGKVWITGQTWTERAAIAIPADVYISDETDRSKQAIVTQYKTRLQHSNYAWEWYFSNPSAPGHGVDKYWGESDQKHWFIKCGCGEWQFMTMENILEKNGQWYFGCKKCGQEIDRRKGSWIRKYNNRDISGYWIPSFLNPKLSAQYIIKKKRDMPEDQFANFVLGEPYVGRGSVLTRNAFFQNLVNRVNPQNARVVIGVDTGVGINFVVGNAHGIFYYNKVDSYEPLEALLNRWPNSIMIIDQGGDIIGPRKLREKYPNRVYLCFFGKDRKNDELIRWKDDDGTVMVDRNKLIQLVVDEYTESRIPVFGTEAEWWDYWLEWSGMYRTEETSDIGASVFEWHKPSTGRCDYPFATVYWRVGMDRFMESSVSFVDPTVQIGSVGMEVSADGARGFLPRNRL